MKFGKKILLACVAAGALVTGAQTARAYDFDNSIDTRQQDEADRKMGGSITNNGVTATVQTVVDANGKKVKVVHLKDKKHGIDARVNLQNGNKLVATFADGASVAFNVAVMPMSPVDLKKVGDAVMRTKALDGGTNHGVTGAKGPHGVHVDAKGKMKPTAAKPNGDSAKKFQASTDKLCLQILEDINNAGGTELVGFATTPYAQPQRGNAKNVIAAAKSSYTRN